MLELWLFAPCSLPKRLIRSFSIITYQVSVIWLKRDDIRNGNAYSLFTSCKQTMSSLQHPATQFKKLHYLEVKPTIIIVKRLIV